MDNIPDTANKSLATLGKFIILALLLFVALTCLSLYFKLFQVLFGASALLAFSAAIGLLAINRRLLPYSIVLVIVAVILAANSIIVIQGEALPIQNRTAWTRLGLGSLFMGIGLGLFTLAIGMRQMNKTDFWASNYQIQFKYPRWAIASWVLVGTWCEVLGAFSLVGGLQDLRIPGL